MSVIDTATNSVQRSISLGAASRPSGVAVSPGGQRLYVADFGADQCLPSRSDTVWVIDTATDLVTAEIRVDAGPFGIAFSPDGLLAYVANYCSNTVSVVDVATDRVTLRIPLDPGVDGYPLGVAASPTRPLVYVAIPVPSTAAVIDTAANSVITRIGTLPANAIAVTPDGMLAYVTATVPLGPSVMGSVVVISTTTNEVTATLDLGRRNLDGVAITPDGAFAYVADETMGDVLVIDTATNEVSSAIQVGSGPTSEA